MVPVPPSFLSLSSSLTYTNAHSCPSPSDTLFLPLILIFILAEFLNLPRFFHCLPSISLYTSSVDPFLTNFITYCIRLPLEPCPSRRQDFHHGDSHCHKRGFMYDSATLRKGSVLGRGFGSIRLQDCNT